MPRRNPEYTVRGDRIRAFRIRRKHWRQQDLADASGYTVEQISRIENGIHQAKLKGLERIAEALDVEVDDIVEWHIDV